MLLLIIVTHTQVTVAVSILQFPNLIYETGASPSSSADTA